MTTVGELALKKYSVYPPSFELCVVKEDIISRDDEFIIVMNFQDITHVFRTSSLLYDISKLERDNNYSLQGHVLSELDSEITFSIVPENQLIQTLKKLVADVIILTDETNTPVGIIDYSKAHGSFETFQLERKQTEETILEYQKIFEYIEDEIFVTDQNGYVLRLNPTAEKVCGFKACDIIGKNVKDIEITSSCSITMRALEEKKKVNMVQDFVRTGKRLLTTAIPVFNESGEIVRIISTSKDVAEINRIKEELDKKTNELERKSEELEFLREEIFGRVNFVCNCKEMKYIKKTIKKIAPLDLTVLIQGESGVGKEVVTKSIHYLSDRRDQPFIKINCGLIPENLIEAELFGYEAGAFTGASKYGKIGKIELAKGGTLFLDEIGEMPLTLQVKLLEFLQDRYICRVGGTKVIEIDTRVIAATNRDLKEMVEKGLFRQDLFYRLNLIPIVIPALRDRKEDIPELVEFFVKKFNSKYKMNKKLAPETMKTLYYYDWPGNVRELEHVMERVIVTNDTDMITLEHINIIFGVKPQNYRVICNQLMPLKTAKREIEEQLVRAAYEMYHSTYKAAEALEIDQSTVVKILKKYNIRSNKI